MNAVAHTSKAAYQHHVSSGNKQFQRQVIVSRMEKNSLCPVFREEKLLTRRELSNLTGFSLGDVAARVNKLVKDELLVECGKTRCATTDKLVGLVGLPE